MFCGKTISFALSTLYLPEVLCIGLRAVALSPVHLHVSLVSSLFSSYSGSDVNEIFMDAASDITGRHL